jgi:hypothetical protein
MWGCGMIPSVYSLSIDIPFQIESPPYLRQNRSERYFLSPRERKTSHPDVQAIETFQEVSSKTSSLIMAGKIILYDLANRQNKCWSMNPWKSNIKPPG